MAKKRSKPKKGRDSTREDILTSKEFSDFQSLFSKIVSQYNIDGTYLHSLLKDELLIPSTIFCSDVSGLQIIVKYLRENCGLSNVAIGKLVNRSVKTISQAYVGSQQKHSSLIHPQTTRYNIPVSIFADRSLSVLEHIVVYLKDTFQLKLSDIARLLHRNDRTIWTVYQRATKKRN